MPEHADFLVVDAVSENRSPGGPLPGNSEKNREIGESRLFQPIFSVENTFCLRGLGRTSLLAITGSIPARFREARTGIQRAGVSRPGPPWAASEAPLRKLKS